MLVRLQRHSLRLSHVGRRLVTFEPSIVSMQPIPVAGHRPTSFQQTVITERILAKGPLGELSFPIHKGLKWETRPGLVGNEQALAVGLDEGEFEKMNKYNQKFVMSMWGTTASALTRIVEGVSEGFQVSLRLVGVGYKVALDKDQLVLKVGYSHDVVIPLPAGIKATCPTPTRIVLFGIDYQKVTQLAAFIRSKRKPEPYNGKGIFVGDETITLKEGKKK